MTTIHAEIRIPTSDLRADISFFTTTLKSAHGYDLSGRRSTGGSILRAWRIRVRIETGASEAPVTLRILCEDPSSICRGRNVDLVAPNGTKVEIRHGACTDGNAGNPA